MVTQPANKARKKGDSNAASGAPTSVAAEPPAAASPGPVSITTLLEMDGSSPDAHLMTWAAQMKAYVDTMLMHFLSKHQANLIRVAIPHQRIEGNLSGGSIDRSIARSFSRLLHRWIVYRGNCKVDWSLVESLCGSVARSIDVC